MNRLACMTTFVKVVETGSFAGAAVAVGLSPAMVGRQVASLEAHLGAVLLSRSTRRQRLTEAGRIFYERSLAVIAELEAAEDSVARMRDVPRGLLRIDAPVTFGTHSLAPALPDFFRAYPEVRIELTLTNRVVDIVEEGYDAVLRTGALANSNLLARSLAPYRVVACAAPTYLKRHGKPRTPADLARHACLGFHPGRAYETWTFRGPEGKPFEVRVSGPLVSNNGDALRAAALGGLGIIAQSSTLVADDLEAGTLVPVLERYAPPALPMHVIFASDRTHTTKLRSFLEWLSSRFGPQVTERSRR